MDCIDNQFLLTINYFQTGVNISTYFLDQDRERFWILGVLGKGFLWHKSKFVKSLILLMHFICKKGKNLEIHPSFGYSWANYEKNKENFGKKCLVLPFWLGKSFWWCRERFHFLGRYIYPCNLTCLGDSTTRISWVASKITKVNDGDLSHWGHVPIFCTERQVDMTELDSNPFQQESCKLTKK